MVEDCDSIVITGSSSGIGLAIARRFAVGGYRIMLNGLPMGEVEERGLIDEMLDLGAGDCYFSCADMADNSAIALMMAEAGERFGGVSVLVNNAGIQHVAPIEEFPASRWDDILAINLSSAFHTISWVIPMMRKRGGGRIINIASAHALVASPYKSAYVAAKHGLLGLTKTVALEQATMAITCNAICPGFVATALVDKQITALAEANNLSRERVLEDVILAGQPTRRLVVAENIAELAWFLSLPAAADITGAALPIDGAWTAR